MPQAYLPNEVENALEVLDNFVFEKKSKVRSAAQPRGWYDRPENQNDRVRYHKASISELRNRLNDISYVT